MPFVGFVRIVQSLENLHFFPATSNIDCHHAHPNKSLNTFRISHWALDSAAFFIISLERMIFNASSHPVKTIDSVDWLFGFSLKVFFFCGRCRPDATKGSPSVLVSFALTTSIFSSQPRKKIAVCHSLSQCCDALFFTSGACRGFGRFDASRKELQGTILNLPCAVHHTVLRGKCVHRSHFPQTAVVYLQHSEQHTSLIHSLITIYAITDYP